MGLSILIPIYNYDIAALTEVLHKQLTANTNQGEIILLDDGSLPEFVSKNQSVANKLNIRYILNKKNEGRQASRQKLSNLARYDYLLFLDCDSEIINNDFLSIYFSLADKNIELASGGRIYTSKQPADCALRLHWKYGSSREAKSPAFMSNNFLVKKKLFTKLEMAIPLDGYGHEDSWWGIQFEKAGISCAYIKNPTLHTGLEKSTVFISKSENALDNLLQLEKNIEAKILSKQIKIFRVYNRLKRWKLHGLYLFLEKPFHNYFYKNLTSCHPSLFCFDCYRLAVLLLKKMDQSHL